MQTIHVSSKSSTGMLAEVIVQHLNAAQGIALKAIGAGAVNQAAKGIAVAECNLHERLVTNIAFFNVVIADAEKSGLIFMVKKEENNGKV